jgi:hypothetical protein
MIEDDPSRSQGRHWGLKTLLRGAKVDHDRPGVRTGSAFDTRIVIAYNQERQLPGFVRADQWTV